MLTKKSLHAIAFLSLFVAVATRAKHVTMDASDSPEERGIEFASGLMRKFKKAARFFGFQSKQLAVDNNFKENQVRHHVFRRSVQPANGENDVFLSPWQPWSSCNCRENATQTRTRRCFIVNVEVTDRVLCGQDLTQSKPCTIPCNDSSTSHRWSAWLPWESCSASCGFGMRLRRRLCEGQAPGSRPTSLPRETSNGSFGQETTNLTNEGLSSDLCPGGPGNASEMEECLSESDCWSEWSEWSDCPLSCGFAVSGESCPNDCVDEYRSSSRYCLSGNCQGRRVKRESCLPFPCWSPWSNVFGCSGSCTRKFGLRYRYCAGGSFFGEMRPNAGCRGSSHERVPCDISQCASGLWGPWSRYSHCSRSCGGGLARRSRRCITGRCTGRKFKVARCNTHACPTWGPWSSYACCSATCGEGMRNRTRTCNGANFPVSGWCRGPNRDEVPCQNEPCGTNRPSVLGSFECGLSEPAPTANAVSPVLKILGGVDTSANKWPWQANWQHREMRHLCGATLVAPQWLVTAAHCIRQTPYYRVDDDNPGNSWSVMTGMHRLYHDGTEHFVSQVFVHEGYRFDGPVFADIALLKLREPVTITNETRPICLDHVTVPQQGDTCYVTGWGSTDYSENWSEVLQEAQVPVLNFTDCQELGVRYQRYLNETSHLCAGNATSMDAPDSCEGDSGGPLVCRRGDNQWYFAGVTSFGFEECGTPGHIGIYTPVAHFIDWIREKIEGHTHDIC